MCAGHSSGAEAAIHAMHDIFDENETEAVLLIDAENAFNSINRNAMIHNIAVLCPIIATFVKNCYNVPARLFVIGGKELLSKEGTTQGDPTAMGAYAIGLTPLLRFLHNFIISNSLTTKQVAFADDFTVAGKVEDIKMHWDILCVTGPKYGYFPKAEKSFLIVKENHESKANNIFTNCNVEITSTGQRHLGAVVGDIKYKDKYVNEKINSLVDQTKILAKIAEIEPQAAYSAFIAGFKSKLNYLMRTIPDIQEKMMPLEELIRHEFIPAITGGHQCSEIERELLTLPPRLGGLGLNIFSEDSEIEYQNSRLVTNDIMKAVYEQNFDHEINLKSCKTTKQNIKASRIKKNELKLNKVRDLLNTFQLRLNDVCKEKGASNWLTVLPMSEHDFNLNKQQFWDAIRLRYGWPIPNLPTVCACGSKFDLQHCMSCKKGGFITLRHNSIRDLTANMLKEVCSDVKIEPPLLELSGEIFQLKTSKTGNEVRTDIAARGFWIKGQRAFFDVRVFDPNASRYLKQTMQQSYAKNESEKKRNYNERILNVDNGSFTPLVFSLYGGMSRECKTFYARLSEMISEKRKTPRSITSSWIRTKICFSLLNASLLCIRGSRSIYKTISVIGDDIVLNDLETKM